MLGAAAVILIGIRIRMDAARIATAISSKRKTDVVTQWLLNHGVKHSPKDERRLVAFATFAPKWIGLFVICFGILVALKTLWLGY